ncbi:MAG TPA: ABC transporter ATP-binding protein [Chloroflexota bacterium]|nr:ABC transporter ATP-binding protein [Chloroflexota bacterium]
MMHGSGWWSYIRYDEEQDKPIVSRELLKRVAGYARPYTRGIVLMLLTILGIDILTLIPPLLFRDLIDNALPNQDFGRLNLLALGMIGIPLFNGLIGVFQRILSARIGEGLIFDLRCALFEHLQRMSLRFFTNTKTGEVMARLNNDVVGAQQAVTSTVVSILSNGVALVLTMAVMLSLEWRLTLLAVAVLPFFIFPARRVGRVLREVTREGMNRNAQMNALMNETLNVSGALLVKIFGRGRDEDQRFRERAAGVRDIGIRQAVIGRWFFLGLGLASSIGTAMVFWLGGVLVLRGEFTVGTIVAFGTYLTQLYGPLAALTNARVEFATSLVSFERVFEVLDLPLEIADRPDARTLDSVAGNVHFEHVSFDYGRGNGSAQPFGLSQVRRWRSGEDVPLSAGAKKRHPAGEAKDEDADGAVADGVTLEAAQANRRSALTDVSFEILPGQLAALVGPSGAGKTTITYLLPRLYDPTDGRILIDGVDVREIRLDSLAAEIGVVTQETYLFHDSIRSNLLYARPWATDDELRDACLAANIHDFIAGLPDGYDTVVGERGYRLSGGEKQRIAIARVLLKDPRILVLDEATSHLDSQSEAVIQAALERVMMGRTSLVIAHRLSTILAADVILVMDEGRLAERGTHRELMERGGLYANLYETQFRARAPHEVENERE